MSLQVLHEKIILDISLAERTIQGWCAISAKFRQSVADIRLHVGQITISGVRVNGADRSFHVQPAENESFEAGDGVDPIVAHKAWPRPSYDAPTLVINAEGTEGEPVLVEIAYAIPEASSACSFTVNPDGSCSQLIVLACHEQARHWMPCLDTIRERCKWDLELSIQPSAALPLDQLFVVGSGALVQQIHDEARNRKVFSYKLDIPVPACKIGFVAGLFEMHKVHGIPNAHLFAPHSQTQNGSKIGPVVDFLTRSFGYLNWLLNTRYPWAGFYLMFARDPPHLSVSLPNLVLLPTACLHDVSVIDQTWETRRILCGALIEQYYFCKALPDLCDRWIVPALCRYLSLHQLRVFHGNNDYRLQLRLDLEQLLELDDNTLTLYTSNRCLFELEQPVSVSNARYECIARKGRLVLVLLEQALGKQNIQKILMQMFIDANSGDRVVEDIFSINYLQRCIKRITGKEMRGFLEQWLLSAGYPQFDVSFSYNRKKSCVEFDVRQSYSLAAAGDEPHGGKKSARFTGPLLIRIHETDSAYDHIVHIEDTQHHFELPFHTKMRKPRQSKKPESQVPASDEAGHDDEAASNKVSPVSWIRIDPDVEWIARISLHQPDVMWIEQLENDRDVIAQWDAINALTQLPSESTCYALERAIADFKAFHRIRAAGLIAMSSCSIPELQFSGARKLMDMFIRRFGMKDMASGEVLPRPNNFENLPNYYLLLSVPEAMSRLRDAQGRAPDQAVQVLLGLLKYNDNSSNAYSDYHYVAHVIDCIGAALTDGCANPALVSEVLAELDRFAYLERILPSHRNAVMASIISALAKLQSVGLCHHAADVYADYLSYGNYSQVRVAAATALLKLYPREAVAMLLDRLLHDPSKPFRTAVGIVLLQGNIGDATDLLFAAVKQSTLTGRDQLRRLAEKLYPDKSAAAVPSPLPHLTFAIPSPKKMHGLEPADWENEISEGAPVISLRRENRDVFSSNVLGAEHKPQHQQPKLKLSIVKNLLERPLRDKALSVIDALWEHPDSYPFRYPVDRSVPHYYDIIKSPMNLSLLKTGLDSIATPQEFVASLRLVFDNCFQFNHPQSMIFSQAKELKKQAVKELKRAFPELKASVKSMLTGDVLVSATAAASTMSAVAREDRFEMEAMVRNLINRLKQMPESFWFLQPVDPVALNIPSYFDIVKEPMDLGTLSGKLDTESYHGHKEVLRDIKLVFTNCYLFNNPSDPVCHDAQNLERIVQESFPEYADIVITEHVAPKPDPKPVLKLKLTLPAPEPERSFEEPCKRVLECVRQDDQSGPFQHPVVGVPGYAKVIRRPMDLSTIDAKLSKHGYPSASAFKADLELVWSNCVKFNGLDAPISAMANHLAALTENLFNEFGL